MWARPEQLTQRWETVATGPTYLKSFFDMLAGRVPKSAHFLLILDPFLAAIIHNTVCT